MQLKALYDFSFSMLELLEGNIPLNKALKEVSCMKSFSRNIRRELEDVHTLVENGSLLSIALEGCEKIIFPDWYFSVLKLSEINGNLAMGFKQLVKRLEKKKQGMERFFRAASYPFFTGVLCIFGAFFMAHVFFAENFWGEGQFTGKKDFMQTLMFASVFLCTCYGGVFLVMKRLFCEKASILFFEAMAFLMEMKCPVEEALECCRKLCEKNRALCQVILDVEVSLLRGEKIFESFSRSFSEVGFREEKNALDLTLGFCEVTGSWIGFKRCSELMERRDAKKQERFLVALEPFLILCTGIFMVMILKDIFLPVFTGFGGLSW